MIKVRDLCVVLGDREILHSISLDVDDGETMVLLGPSGSGKTVFLKTLLGLMKPSSGTVEMLGVNLAGIDHAELLKIREKTGMVFQSSALFDSLSVWENVGFFLLEHTNLSEDEVRRRASETLAAVGLESVLDRKPEELSGGMKKRVGIARALISGPQIIFYDEPTVGLDVITAESIMGFMRKIHAKYRTTDFIVTHDLSLAKNIADRVAVIDRGNILVSGAWSDILKSGHPFVRDFLNIGERDETKIDES